VSASHPCGAVAEIEDEIVLYYHHVDDIVRDHTFVSPAELRAQLRWLSERRTARALGTAAPAGVPAFAVTFDDGYDDVRAALPILATFGVAATFFVLPAVIGGTSRFNRGGLESRHLSRADVLALRRAGHAIGSHGMRHADVRGLSDAELDDDLRRSQALLEDLLGEPVRHFAYPYGWCDRRAARVCAAVYDAAWSTNRAKACAGGLDRYARARAYLHPRGEGYDIVG
jgi:peptidoglycan/xylan/chitin deacetylase (PgdA/CDA1 family)